MTVTTLPPPRPVVWPLRPPEWYAHVPGTMPYAGGTYPRYLVWHPLDHVSYEIENADPVGHPTVVAPGTRLHIVEALGEFTSTRSGAGYLTRMTLGDDTLPGRLMLNRVARTRALPPHKLERWIRHHIEEIGNLENFLPDLFDARADREP
jgi:hypothetical protein